MSQSANEGILDKPQMSKKELYNQIQFSVMSRVFYCVCGEVLPLSSGYSQCILKTAENEVTI